MRKRTMSDEAMDKTGLKTYKNPADKMHAIFSKRADATYVNAIDVVVPYVDGNDPAWQKCRDEYKDVPGDKRTERFRDWGLMRYWFRGIEKNMGWIRKVHFVTWGHVPAWLNADHPKLHIVRHEDYIPSEYLPTFSSHPIELNIHRIPGLADRFIYFNDDIFVLNEMTPQDFFYKGLPCDTAALGILLPFLDRTFANILINDLELVSRNFDARNTIRSQLFHFLHYRYGMKRNLSTLMLIPRCQDFFTGFQIQHGPNAYLKKTFEDIWNAEGEILDKTCRNRFRSPEDVNQYIFKYWQWCSGNFYPTDTTKRFRFFDTGNASAHISEYIRTEKTTGIIVINDDNVPPEKFDEIRNNIADAFEIVYPEKCSFEKM